MLILALLLNPPWGGLRPSRPLVALDVSMSWLRGTDSAAWLEASRTARDLAGDSVLLVGSALRIGAPPDAPVDTSARLLDAAERAQLAGRPLTLITDGELRDDTAALRARLPSGSQVRAVAPVRLPDIAITALESPPAAIAGDSVTLRIQLAAAREAPPAAELVAYADGRIVSRRTLAPFAAWQSRVESLALRLPPGPAEARLVVLLRAAGDGEPRNDKAERVIHRGQRITGLAVSTAPDFDFREIVRVMRGALSIPVPARFLVARGRWVDDSGRVVAEGRLRGELAAAQVVVLHGDTGYFGQPRVAVRGSLALIPAVTEDSEWYVSPPPPSLLSPILGTLPFDSLPPVTVGAEPRAGVPIVAMRASGERRRIGAVLEDGDRRVIIAPIRGTARWALRGGAPADAFATFWGAMLAVLADRPGGGIRSSDPTISVSELHPRGPVLASWGAGRGAIEAQRSSLRSATWPYLLLVLFLCAEWVLRRRAGLR